VLLEYEKYIFYQQRPSVAAAKDFFM